MRVFYSDFASLLFFKIYKIGRHLLDNLTRLHYLQALGVDVWIPRSAAVATDPSGETVLVAGSGQAEEPDDWTLPAPLLQDEPPTVDNWEALQAEVAACTCCGLCETRTQTVFGTGNKQTDWMVIGEAPGQQEDQQGLPFVGNAGLLLTEMLRAIGLNREEVFITNILKCRPPNNRDPKPEEAESCHGYLQRQFALIQPKIILAIGRISAQSLLKTDEPLSRLRGKPHTFNNTPVIVVYHPAYLLRSPTEKRKAWQDLQLAVLTHKNNKG